MKTIRPKALDIKMLLIFIGLLATPVFCQDASQVIGWGLNCYGQTNVPANLTNVVAIAAGWYHNLALWANGTVTAWGWNGSLDHAYGQTNVPAGLSNVMAIAAGSFHNLTLKSDGTVVAWGCNSLGQATVPTGLSNVVAIAAGGYSSLALQADGTVFAWVTISTA